MTEEQSKKLRVGNRVTWDAGTDGQVCGEVVDAGHHAVTIRWDDGQTGTIDHRDGQRVAYVSCAEDDTEERCAICGDEFAMDGPAGPSRVDPSVCQFCYVNGGDA